MQVRYVGPFDAVEVNDRDPELPPRWVAVKQGESIEVGTKQAKALLEQPTNWAEARDKKGGEK